MTFSVLQTKTICLVFSNHFDSLFLLFSGPPGAGKSTTGMLLARKHGYIYYEADCFGMFANPFVDPNVEEPTLQVLKQKPLKVMIQNVCINHTVILHC